MALFLLAGPWLARPASAHSGIVHSVPPPTVKSRSGLQLTIDTRWFEGPGYRPVRVEVRAMTASVADRTVTVQFRVSSGPQQAEPSVEVEQQIDIPANVTVVGTILAVPQFQRWNYISWDTWVDGERAAELSETPLRASPTGGIRDRGDVPAVLAIGSPAAVVKALGGFADHQCKALGIPISGTSPGALRWASAASTTNSTKFATVAAADLPTRWIDYSCADIVCLSADQLGRIAGQQPEAWHAIEAWTRAGGNLWVYGTGESWRRLGEIERAIGLPAQPVEDRAARLPRGWQLPEASAPRGAFWATDNADNSPQSAVRRDRRAQRRAAAAPVQRDARRPGFAYRDLDLGRVVAMQSAAPFPGLAPVGSGAAPANPTPVTAQPESKRVDLEWLLGTLGPERYLWEQRYGFSTGIPTDDFWEFLIPGVGLAPVTAFHILLTLFVLALGPLNYYLLYRRNRLHLLVVTVPLAAVIVTGSLFVYAVFADGLATRVRARSLTIVDQQRDHAVRWSRLSYYAGLTPSAGLTFPLETVVLPLLPIDGNQGPVGLCVEWDTAERLTQGWLRARTPTQYVTVRSSRADIGLDIHTDQAPFKLENRLGAHLELLIVSDAEGKFYLAADVAQGASMVIGPVAENDAIGQIRARISAAQLRPPAGLRIGRRRRTRNRWSRFGSPQMAVACPERVIKSLAVMPTLPGSGWRKRMYVAVARPPACIDLGAPDAREEASLHVIVGRW